MLYHFASCAMLYHCVCRMFASVTVGNLVPASSCQAARFDERVPGGGAALDVRGTAARVGEHLGASLSTTASHPWATHVFQSQC